MSHSQNHGYLNLSLEYIHIINCFYNSFQQPLSLHHKNELKKIAALKEQVTFRELYDTCELCLVNDMSNTYLDTAQNELLNLLNWHSEYLLISLSDTLLDEIFPFDITRFRQIQVLLMSYTPFQKLIARIETPISDNDLINVLQKCFNKQSYKPMQLEAIKCSLDEKHIMCLFPTGYGKSLIYQVLAAIQFGVAVVFSPLCSLIDDQIIRLENIGINCSWMRSDLVPGEENEIIHNLNLKIPKYRVLFITPEKFIHCKRLQNTLDCLYQRNLLKRIVFDEAHCISLWGLTFRPSYLDVCMVRTRYPLSAVIALTATASGSVLLDIKHLLKLQTWSLFRLPFNRPNLSFNVLNKTRTVAKDICHLIKSRFNKLSGIVFCRTQSDCETLSKYLNQNGIVSAYYHADISSECKGIVLRNWKNNHTNVVCATIAFGLGVDKKDVRFVLHHTMPSSAEAYLQACGRAGRDGLAAFCYLFYSPSDVSTVKSLICSGDTRFQIMEIKVKELFEFNRILSSDYLCKKQYLRLLLDDDAIQKCQDNEVKCDICSSNIIFHDEDVTRETYAVLKCLLKSNVITVFILRKLVAGHYHRFFTEVDTSDVVGILSHWTKSAVADFIDFLLLNGYLKLDYIFHQNVPVGVLSATEFGLETYQNIEIISNIYMKIPTGMIASLHRDSNDPPTFSIFPANHSWRSHCSFFKSVHERKRGVLL